MKRKLLLNCAKASVDGRSDLQLDAVGQLIEQGLASTAAHVEAVDDTHTAVSVDAALLAACAEASHWDQRCREINTRKVFDNDCDVAIEGWDKAFLQVAQSRARTMDGIRAKAVVLQMALRREHELTAPYERRDTFTPKALLDGHDNRKDLYLAWMLVADILQRVP